MENMFSGNTEKKIPKNLKDCYMTDKVSHNLWIWCERLEKLGEILFWFLLIGGLLLSITSSIIEKEVIVEEASYLHEAKTELRKTFDFELFIPLLLDTALYAFLEYCAYHIIALLIGALASIVQHTKITADVALYNSTKSENPINKPHTEYQPPQSTPTKTNSPGTAVNNWKCSKCGESNTPHALYCKNCGTYK